MNSSNSSQARQQPTNREGRVLKLSNRKWKTHERFLRIDRSSICYFSKVSDAMIGKAKKGECQPKQSVPLLYVSEISLLN